MAQNSNRIPGSRQPLTVNPDSLATPEWFRFWEALSELAFAGQYTVADAMIDAATNDTGTAEVTRKTDDALLLAWMNDA